MNEQESGTISHLLREIRSGDERSRNELYERLRQDLRSRAHAMMAAERSDHTLDASALLHEAFERMIRGSVDEKVDNRRQVFALATLAMRHVLIDHARRRNRERREGRWKKTPLDAVIDQLEERNGCKFTDLYEALNHLQSGFPRSREIVDLHFFGGLTFAEIGEQLGISTRTVMRDWRTARARLQLLLATEE